MSDNYNNDSAGARSCVHVFVLAFFLLLACYMPYFNGSKEFVLGDCQYTYQPICKFVGSCLSKGFIPLWNPHSYCGFPQVALSTPSLFYPLNYLLFLLPFSRGVALYLLLHQFLSGLAAFFFVDKLLQNKEAATFASLSTMFCGYLFAVYKFPDFAASVCVLLFCLWGSAEFYRAALQKQKIWFAFLCLSNCLLFFSGRPEIFIPGSFLLFIYSGCEIWILHRVGTPICKLIGTFVVWMLALLFGMLLACPLILPSCEWTALSPRFLGLEASQVFQWSTSWYDWLSLVFWRVLGDLEQVRMSAGSINSIIQTGHAVYPPLIPPAFMGPGFFTVLCLGFLDRRFKSRLLCLLLCLVAALVCAGDQTPVAPFFIKVFPRLALLRYPIKVIIFALLPAIFVAARGLSEIFTKSSSSKILYFFLGFWIFILLLGPSLYFSGAFGTTIKFLVEYCKTAILASEYQIAQHDLLISFLVTGGIGTAFMLLACLYKKGYLCKRIAYFGLLTLAVAPMVCYGADVKEKAGEAGYYEKPAMLDVIMQQIATKRANPEDNQFRITHFVDEPLFMPATYEKATKSPWFLANTRFGRDMLLSDMQIATRWNYANGYANTKTTQIEFLLLGADGIESYHKKMLQTGKPSDYPLARFCALSNSKYVITEERYINEIIPLLDPQLFSLVHVDKNLNLRIYQVNNSGHRFYFASNIQVFDTWKNLALETISANNKTIFDDAMTYLPKSALPLLLKCKAADDSRVHSSGSKSVLEKQALAGGNASPPKLATFINLISDEPGRIELLLQKNAPGLLVARDQFYPGWKVLVDGKEQPLLQANLFNRAVFISPGRHSVIFQYFPESLIRGFMLAVSGFLAALLLFLVLHFRAKDRE